VLRGYIQHGEQAGFGGIEWGTETRTTLVGGQKVRCHGIDNLGEREILEREKRG